MTSTTRSLPSRATVNSIVSPGWWVRIATIRAMPSVTFSPSTAVITSSFSSPLSSAGVLFWTESIRAPSPSVSPVCTLAPMTG